MKYETVLVRRFVQLNQPSLPPNHLLNLTEPAVDDFARAKQTATIGLDLPRADMQPCQRIFRRRLAQVR